MYQYNNNYVTKTRRRVLIIALVATLAILTLAGVLTLMYINNNDNPNNRGESREDNVNQPVSTINLQQWLQDNPHEMIRGVDLGASNTQAVLQEDATLKIFDSTSFSDINKSYPNINVATLDFYLDLDNYRTGVYRYSFRIIFDNADTTIQSYAICTIAIYKSSNNFVAYVLCDTRNEEPGKKLRLESLYDRISIKFGVDFLGSNTKVNFDVCDASRNSASTILPNERVSYYKSLANDPYQEYSHPTSIRSISYASYTSHTFNNSASATERLKPSIDIRSLQLA